MGRAPPCLSRPGGQPHLTTPVTAVPPGPVLLLCQGWARFQCVEDDAGELAFEAADCLAAALALALLTLQVSPGRGMDARLRDRDPVERAVQLAVAATVEPVAAN